MPTTYLGRTILTAEEFLADQQAGWFNSRATYDDYLAMIREQVAIKREAQEAARRDGYELGAPELDLSPEDEEILDRVWDQIRAEKAAARERERLPRVA